MTFSTHREEAGGAAAVSTLPDAPFGAPVEGRLVRDLRRDGRRVPGDVALSRLAAEENGMAASALTPLAVLAAWQRRGIGARRVATGLDAPGAAGEDLALVLGDPAHCRRFGFSAEAARAFATPYDGPPLQALALSRKGAEAGGHAGHA